MASDHTTSDGHPPQLNRNYVAFISYRHSDNKAEGRQWASWLHHSLETYEVPEDIVGTENLRKEIIPERLYPVFRDEEELPADADLSSPIVRALRQSQYLIVLCSPGAVSSRFVGDEITQFKAMGRADRIIGAIISGEPNASISPDPAVQISECFPEAFRFEINPDGTVSDRPTEPLAADFRLSDGAEGWTNPEAYRQSLREAGLPGHEIDARVADYRERLDLMKLKIIAGILGVPLGVLSERDKAYQLEKARKSARALRKWLALTTLLAIGVAVAGVLARKNQLVAEARKAEVVQTLANSDFQQGTGFLEDLETTPQGMALLARALREGGDSRAATRLWTLLQQRAFWIPVSATSAAPAPAPAPEGGLPPEILERFGKVELDGAMVSPKRIVRSGDGKRVVTLVGDPVEAIDARLRIWDSGGAPLTDWFAPAYSGMFYLYELDAKFSDDGRFLAIIAQPWRERQYIEIRDLESGKAIGGAITSSGRGPQNQFASFTRVDFLSTPPGSGGNIDAYLLTASTKGNAALHGIIGEYGEVVPLAVNEHAASVAVAEVDPGRRWLMSSSSDGEIRVSGIENGELLGDLLKLEHAATRLERIGESQLAAALESGEVRQFVLREAHAAPLPADIAYSANPEDACFRWAIDSENPPPDQILGTASGWRVVRLSDRRIGLRKADGAEVHQSPAFGSNLDTVGILESGQVVSTTTNDFVTELWKRDFSERLGPPFRESRFFTPGATPQETIWVALLPDRRSALLESFFWDPPNLARNWYSLWDIRTGLLLMDRTPIENFGAENQVDSVRLDDTGQYILFLTAEGDFQSTALKPLYGIQVKPPGRIIHWLPDLAEAIGGIWYNRSGNPEATPERQRILSQLLPRLDALR